MKDWLLFFYFSLSLTLGIFIGYLVSESNRANRNLHNNEVPVSYYICTTRDGSVVYPNYGEKDCNLEGAKIPDWVRQEIYGDR